MIIKLLKTGYLKASKHPISAEYNRFTYMGVIDAAFIGQMNEDGKPDGIVRVIKHNGGVYEGQITPDGQFNGFGRDLFSKESLYTTSYLGW